MLVRIVGSEEVIAPLLAVVTESLEEIGLSGVVPVETTDADSYAQELEITKFPALCIEEEAIDFKDMIFE